MTTISKKDMDLLKEKVAWDKDRFKELPEEIHPDDIGEDFLPKGEMFPAFDDKDTWAFELPTFKLFHLGHQHFVCISETPAESLPPSFMDSLNKWLGVDGVLYVCLHDGETYSFGELKNSESFTALFENMLGKYMASAPIYPTGIVSIKEAKKELIYGEPRKSTGKYKRG